MATEITTDQLQTGICLLKEIDSNITEIKECLRILEYQKAMALAHAQELEEVLVNAEGDEDDHFHVVFSVQNPNKCLFGLTPEESIGLFTSRYNDCILEIKGFCRKLSESATFLKIKLNT